MVRPAEHVKGPGDYLHERIERWTGEKMTADCPCKDRLRRMNAWGPAGCREHLDEIVVWLVDEAMRRGREPGGSVWLNLAGWPGARFVCRRLVLSAIREAEKATSPPATAPPATPG